MSAALLDPQGREIRYLRVSVTDHCNFRCIYCSPAHWGAKEELLTAGEIVRLVALFRQVGARRVRITGGEPTVRKDLLEIVRGIRGTGIEEIALSSNASRLAELAAPLRDAGVGSANISLDTLREDRFARLTPTGALGPVLAGVDAAVKAFESVKLNTVLVGGINDDEAPAIVRWAWAHGAVPRFIELMPFQGHLDGMISTDETLSRLAAAGIDLAPALPQGDGRPRGPAAYHQGQEGRVGFIGAMTRNFCAGCNRVRISAAGELQPCLGGHERAPLKALLRGGAGDDEILAAVRAAMGQKREGHDFLAAGRGARLFPMMGIGG